MVSFFPDTLGCCGLPSLLLLPIILAVVYFFMFVPKASMGDFYILGPPKAERRKSRELYAMEVANPAGKRRCSSRTESQDDLRLTNGTI